MNVDFSVTFDQQFALLTAAQKRSVKDTIELFIDDPFNDSLRNHPLRGEWARYRSISTDDDLRIHYRAVNKDTTLFVAVGNHKQLYK